MTIVMLDTNILIYHLTRNNEIHSPPSSQLLGDVRRGKRQVYCPSTAIMESCFVLEQKFGASRDEISPILADIVSLQGVHCEYKPAVIKALAFWQQHRPLDFADCYHLALAEELGINQIYSFDKKMDRYPGVERIEPEVADA